MSPNALPREAVENPTPLNPRVAAALVLLREAHEAAQLFRRDAWEFAVEIGQLHAAGLTNTHVRGLMCLGYTLHAVEKPRSRCSRRLFHPPANLSLSDTSCFILTETGLKMAARQLRSTTALSARLHEPPRRPVWDPLLRQLRWHGHVVKHFRLPAPNQEAILAALEEEGWPPRMDDPLPLSADIDPKVRLHDAIKALNRHQCRRLLSFRGDGTGQGITWHEVAAVSRDT